MNPNTPDKIEDGAKNQYRCSVCDHTEHADINAAKNIRDRYLLTLEGQTGRFQPSERVVV